MFEWAYHGHLFALRIDILIILDVGDCGGIGARDLARRQHRRFLEVVFRPPATHLERNGFDASLSGGGAWSGSKAEEQHQGHLPLPSSDNAQELMNQHCYTMIAEWYSGEHIKYIELCIPVTGVTMNFWFLQRHPNL